ncbi:MAG: transcriptional regulator [Marivibrio sp.]|uniref:P-II family nitrogen regulator n=1 Tax=Marivibrio sp. TaxID=2039719 RepID=UPI0032EBE151
MDDLPTYPKKRLSIIIEAPFLNRLLDLLDGLDVPGYSALPLLAGRGNSGSWRRDSLSSDAGRMVQVLVVLDEKRVAAVLKEVKRVLDRQMGIVTIGDVQVLRPEHF